MVLIIILWFICGILGSIQFINLFYEKTINLGDLCVALFLILGGPINLLLAIIYTPPVSAFFEKTIYTRKK